MNYAAVMASVVTRDSVRAQTLASLFAEGIAPEVFISPETEAYRKARIEEIRRNVHRAFSYGVQQHASYVLYLEDDIIAAPGLSMMIDGAIQQNVHAFTPYLPGTKSHRPDPVPQGLFPIKQLSSWVGAQCLLMRADVVRMMLGGGPPQCADMWLRDILLRNRWALHSCHPNRVQHREGPSSWLGKGRRHSSGTFSDASTQQGLFT